MMETNIDRMFKSHVDYYCYHKNDSIRMTDNNDIVHKGTPIGMLTDVLTNDGCYLEYIVLSMQDYKRLNLKPKKKEIADKGNKYGYPVVYVPQVDIGFGVAERKEPITLTDYETLLKFDVTKHPVMMAKYTTLKDLELKCEIFVSYDQVIEGEFRSGTDILVNLFLEDRVEDDETYIFLYLVEPEYKDLRLLVDASINCIWFSEALKKPSFEQMDLVSSIHNKMYRNDRGYPLSIKCVPYVKVHKRLRKENML